MQFRKFALPSRVTGSGDGWDGDGCWLVVQLACPARRVADAVRTAAPAAFCALCAQRVSAERAGVERQMLCAQLLLLRQCALTRVSAEMLLCRAADAVRAARSSSFCFPCAQSGRSDALVRAERQMLCALVRAERQMLCAHRGAAPSAFCGAAGLQLLLLSVEPQAWGRCLSVEPQACSCAFCGAAGLGTLLNTSTVDAVRAVRSSSFCFPTRLRSQPPAAIDPHPSPDPVTRDSGGKFSEMHLIKRPFSLRFAAFFAASLALEGVTSTPPPRWASGK